MSVFLTSIGSIISLLIMMAIGYFAQARGWLGPGFSSSISKLIMNIALPCSIFMAMLKYFHPMQLLSLSLGVIYVLIAILLGLLLAYGLVKVFKVPDNRRGLMMVAINGANTVFIGMPLNIALFGEISMPFLLCYYIVNTILIWTLGVWIIAKCDPKNSQAKFDWHHLIPVPLWGFIIALPFAYFPTMTKLVIGTMPNYTFLGTTLSDLGSLVTPLALIYIGIMLRSFGLKNVRFTKDINLTLLGRFVIAPMLMIILIFLGELLGLHLGVIFNKTLVVQSATPSLAVLPILAETYHEDVKYAITVVVISSILFVVIVPIVTLILNILF